MRELPHNNDAEQAVIGAILLEPTLFNGISEKLVADDFFNESYRAIYNTISELVAEQKPIDFQTVADKGKLTVGDIRAIIESVPTSANALTYAEMVKDNSDRRKVLRACNDIENACYTGESADNVLSLASKTMFDLSADKPQGTESIGKIVVESLKQIQKAADKKGYTGVKCGFCDIDRKTSGFQASDLIIVAARPAMGKTAFALQIAQYVAVHEESPCVLFSLEMSAEQLSKRMLASLSSVEIQKLKTGQLEDAEWASVVESSRRLGASPLIIDDTPGTTISQFMAKCRRYKAEKDIKLIVIDYLQLISSDRQRDSRQQEVSEISRNLKLLAKELGVPIIACSQLSRVCETRPDKRPMLSDLRESGAIEQDADIVMFLYRDDYYHENSKKQGITEVLISKHRQGSVGVVELMSQLQYARFKNLDKTV